MAVVNASRQGYSGYSGFSGATGAMGASGFSGISGYSGINGISSSLYNYKIKSNATTGYPGNGYILYNNATQQSATSISISHFTSDNIDIDIFLALLANTQTITIQDTSNSNNYQKWQINGTPTLVSNNGNNHWSIPVILVQSTFTFTNNHNVILAVTSGISGWSGWSGASGYSGYSGYDGCALWYTISFSGTSDHPLAGQSITLNRDASGTWNWTDGSYGAIIQKITTTWRLSLIDNVSSANNTVYSVSATNNQCPPLTGWTYFSGSSGVFPSINKIKNSYSGNDGQDVLANGTVSGTLTISNDGTVPYLTLTDGTNTAIITSTASNTLEFDCNILANNATFSNVQTNNSFVFYDLTNDITYTIDTATTTDPGIAVHAPTFQVVSLSLLDSTTNSTGGFSFDGGNNRVSTGDIATGNIYAAGNLYSSGANIGGTIYAAGVTTTNANINGTLNVASIAATTTSTDTLSLTGQTSAIRTITGTAMLNSQMYLYQSVAQTGTGGYTNLRINNSETTIGSGTRSAIDVQKAGVSKYRISPDGDVVATGTLSQSGNTVFSGSNSITGQSTYQNTTTFTATAPVTFGSTLTANGTAILAGSNSITGATTIQGTTTFTATAPVTVASTFAHTGGAVTLSNPTVWNTALGARVTTNSYTAAGTYTWTKPTNATMVEVICIGGGGGGGSGARGDSTTVNQGGAGGGQGGVTVQRMSAALLPSTVTVIVGAGGTGGTAKTGTGTGNAGTAGGSSSFGGSTYFAAAGGGGGGGGGRQDGTAANGGGVPYPSFQTSTNGGSPPSTNGGTGSTGFSPAIYQQGVFVVAGASGGGLAITTPVATAGGASISATSNFAAYVFGYGTVPYAGTTNSPNAGSGTSTYYGQSTVICVGISGGGGASVVSAGVNSGNGGNGGNGGVGSAGGGGGASSSAVGTQSGAGGRGGDGAVIVFTYY